MSEEEVPHAGIAVTGKSKRLSISYQERWWQIFNRFGPAIMLFAVVGGISIVHLGISDGLQSADHRAAGFRAGRAGDWSAFGGHQWRHRPVGWNIDVSLNGGHGYLRYQ